MGTPGRNAFLGVAEAPDDGALTAVIGRAARKRWDRLCEQLSQLHQASGTWYSYSPKKAGWSFRVFRGKRTIVYLIPRDGGGFDAAFVFGAAAIAAIRQHFAEGLTFSEPYSEGTGVRHEVATMADVDRVLQLAAVKIEN